MGERVEGFSAAALVEAIEGNAREFLLALGRAAGADERDDPPIHWVIGGSPIAYHNCVVRADLTSDATDAAIAASVARFRALGVPGSWHVGPSMRPADLGTRLLAHGFDDAGDERGMAANLQALHDKLLAPDGFVAERVRDERALAAWAQVLSLGFGEGEREAEWVRQMYQRIGFGDELPWRHYLGRWRGEPVATASLFMGAGAAGLYFVSTAPQLRRRGFGGAISLAALRATRALGHRIGVLGSSPAGLPLYRRLGFEEYCTIGLYEWPPPTP